MNDHDITTVQVEQGLRALAERVPAPAVPLADDLARGRTLRRRQRVAVSSAAAAVVAAVGLGGAALAGQAGDAASTPAPAGSSSPSPSRTAATDPAVSEDDGVPAGPDGTEHDRTAIAAALREHLDPAGGRLQPDDGVGYHGGGTARTRAWGITLGWREPGHPGLGQVEVTIADGWAGAGPARCRFPALDVWEGTCSPLVLPDGTEGIRVDDAEGDVTVVHEQVDGEVVALRASRLWGNNSLVALDRLPVDAPALLRAAADRRLSLSPPGTDLPHVVSSLDEEQALHRAFGEAVERERHPGSVELPYSGTATWVGHGTLSTYVEPVTAVFGRGCRGSTCDTVELDGRPVWQRTWPNGETQLVWDGPVRRVSLVHRPDGQRSGPLDLEAAAVFLFDEELQTPLP